MYRDGHDDLRAAAAKRSGVTIPQNTMFRMIESYESIKLVMDQQNSLSFLPVFDFYAIITLV